MMQCDAIRRRTAPRDRTTFQKGNWNTAISKYRRILLLLEAAERFIGKDKKQKRKEIQATTYANLGLCYLKVNNTTDAVDNLGTSIMLDRKNVKAYYRRAQVHTERTI